MKRMFCLSLPFLFLATLFAAEFWEKKEYKQWSQKECAKLLENSPWSKDFTLTQVSVMNTKQSQESNTRQASVDRTAGGGDSSNATSDDGQQLYIKYRVQFRSAVPLRQAIVRQMQIVQKYDSLSPDLRQQFDKNAEAFLAADFANAAVVYVTYSTNSRVMDMELARYWQSQTTDLLKNYVYLSNSKGEKVYLAQYVAAQGGDRSFQFIFPRQLNGAPFVGPQDNSLKLEFTYPIVNQIGNGRGFLEFKPEKMVVQGNIAY